MRRILFALFVGIILLSCSNVKDLKFSKENKDQVIERVEQSRDLTREEITIFMVALTRSPSSDKELEGKTVGQIIEEQKQRAMEQEAKENEAKRLAEDALRKEAQAISEMSKYISVKPFKKSFHKKDYRSGNYEDRIDLAFVFENRSDKDIRVFKGTTVFKNLSGGKIKEISLMNDEGLKAGQKKNWYGSVKFNQIDSEDQRLRDTELENVKFEWIPKGIIFADGSSSEEGEGFQKSSIANKENETLKKDNKDNRVDVEKNKVAPAFSDDIRNTVQSEESEKAQERPIETQTKDPLTIISSQESVLKQNDYYRRIWTKIKKEWVLPGGIHKGRPNLEAVIVILIERDGRISKSWFEKKSGNELYDQSAMQAIKKADPLLSLPKQLSDTPFEIGIRFTQSSLMSRKGTNMEGF